MPDRKKTAVLLSILLALVCVGAVELIACRYCDPELFHAITAPVVETANSAADAVSGAVRSTGQAIDNIFTQLADSIAEAKARRAEEKLRAEAEAAEKAAAQAAENAEEADNQTTTPPLLNISSSVCDPSVTELKEQDGLQLLTGSPVQVVYYHQSDSRWGSQKYGSDKISTHGCGPTAMAMVVSTLTDTIMPPNEMAKWAAEHGYWARHSGSYHSIVIGTATAFGLQAESYPLRSADALRNELMSGKLFVALMGPGHFTQSGHFIILRGVTLSGEILIADPGSPERSLTAWDAQLILDELSQSTASGSPLWIISGPDLPVS